MTKEDRAKLVASFLVGDFHKMNDDLQRKIKDTIEKVVLNNLQDDTRNSVALESFAKYCHKHPGERFWQALRNWSRFSYILGRSSQGHEIDTFYIEGLEGTSDAELEGL